MKRAKYSKEAKNIVLVWSDSKGRWVKADSVCVMYRDCLHCGSKRGYPCVGVQGTMGSTHWIRRDRYQHEWYLNQYYLTQAQGG